MENADNIPEYTMKIHKAKVGYVAELFMKENKGGDGAQICSQSLVIKGIYGFDNGCAEECVEVEKYIDNHFSKNMSPSRYDRFVKKAYRKYKMMYIRKLPKVVS